MPTANYEEHICECTHSVHDHHERIDGEAWCLECPCREYRERVQDLKEGEQLRRITED